VFPQSLYAFARDYGHSCRNGRSERRATRPLWPPARRLGGRGRRLYSRDTHRLVRALGLALAPIMESAQQSAAAGVTDGRGDGRSGRLPRGRIISGIRAQRPGISAVHGATGTLMVPNVNTNAGIFIYTQCRVWHRAQCRAPIRT
jgi:hypothetical protein